MVKPTDSVIYTIPGANSIALDKQSADQIKNRFDAEKENLFQLCLIAAAIRKKGLNAKGHYSSEFEDWWKKNELTKLFGQQSNFTKYASAGEVIDHVARMTNGEIYIQKLPRSLSALYAIHAILKDPQEKKEDWLRTCLHHSQYLEIQDGKLVRVRDKGSVPLINPDATAPKIKAWYENRKNPPVQGTKKKTNDKILALAKISVSGSLYSFDRNNGEHLGSVNIEQLQNFVSELKELITKYGKGFKLESNLQELRIGYRARKKIADPASGLFSKPTKSKLGK